MIAYGSHILLAGLWAGLCAVERRAFLQAMFSRPLVASTGAGLLLGDVSSGLNVGTVLELYFLGGAALGASRPHHETITATAAASLAACLALGAGLESEPHHWALGILVSLGLGNLGRSVDWLLEGYSKRLAHRALASAEQGDLTRAVRQNLWGVWPHFLFFASVTSLCALLGLMAAPLIQQLPGTLLSGLDFAYPAIAAACGAFAVHGSHARRGWVWATVAGLATVAVTLVFRGMWGGA